MTSILARLGLGNSTAYLEYSNVVEELLEGDKLR